MGNGYVKQAVAFENVDACSGYEKDTYIAPEIKKKTGVMDLCPLKKVISLFGDGFLFILIVDFVTGQLYS